MHVAYLSAADEAWYWPKRVLRIERLVNIYRPKGCSQPRELCFFDIRLYLQKKVCINYTVIMGILELSNIIQNG